MKQSSWQSKTKFPKSNSYAQKQTSKLLMRNNFGSHEETNKDISTDASSQLANACKSTRSASLWFGPIRFPFFLECSRKHRVYNTSSSWLSILRVTDNLKEGYFWRSRAEDKVMLPHTEWVLCTKCFIATISFNPHINAMS